MEFLRPASWEEALAAKAEHPCAVPIAGGTDVMVELNFDHRRPEVLMDLGRIAELCEWETGQDSVRLGACVPYSRIIDHLAAELPGLALAARTVGSPQIRNRGSVGGNLGAASPAGDSHPPLLAAGAEVEAVSVRGTRTIPVEEFYTGVKRHCLAPDELIRAVHIRRADGPQQFSKVGTRNAMVIAVCAFGIALHPATRTVRTGVGSAAPTPVRARAAEDFLTAALDEGGHWDRGTAVPPAVAARFGELVASAAAPIDDVRGSARYRLHALTVMARRTLGWAWAEYRGPQGDRSRGMRVTFTVNGRRHEADDVWEGESLLYVLRERLGLPGSKNACEQGECGSCTVRLDGDPVCACLVAAGQAEGREVVTVEGLADQARRRAGGGDAGPRDAACGELSPVQQAFVDAGAVQCGFCTPGLLVTADELLERNPSPADEDIREALSGNLCRCTGYEKILDAVRLAAARSQAPVGPAPGTEEA